MLIRFDIEVELPTTTVTLTPNRSGTLNFSGIYSEYDPEADPVLKSFDDDGTTSAFTEQILDSIEAQTGSRPEAWKIQIKNITADYEWSFKTAQEAPVIHIHSNSAGLNGEDWAEGAYVHDGYSGKTGSGTISAYESATRGEAYLTDYHIMRVGVGSWTDDPDDININDYPVVKINYTIKNPDECRAIVVIISGWSDDGTDTGWVAKYYSVSGNSGTIIADFSDLMDKTYYQVFAGVITCPTVKIGNAFTPGFTAEGVLMNSNTDKITEEYDYHAPEVVLAENIEIVENIYKEESDDPYILTIDELKAIEAVLENDYNK